MTHSSDQVTRSAPAKPKTATTGSVYVQPGIDLPAQFAESALGIVQIDLRRHIEYANQSAMQLLGIPKKYVGMRLDDLFADKGSWRKLVAELKQRRQGAVGNYRLTGTRKSDGKQLEVEVTGLPRFAADGRVVGSLGIFRNLEVERLASTLEELSRNSSASSQELFEALAKHLHQIFSFEMMTISRFSGDFQHLKSFMSIGRAARIHERRWWLLNDANRKWLSMEGVVRIPNIEEFLRKPEWEAFHKSRETQEFLKQGYRSALRRDVKRGNRTIGSFSLISKSETAFSVEHERMLGQLPVEALVAAAFEASERELLVGKLDLLKKLNGCRNIVTACQILAEELARIFHWPHVSIFQVRHGRRKIHLIAQFAKGKPAIRFDEGYEQDIDTGVLGRVADTGATQNVPDVTEDPDYVPPANEPGVRSELAVPVRFDGDPRVRFILNIEELNEAGFCSDEQAALEDLAADVSRSLQRITELHFITQCLQSSSDPIIVVDTQHNVRAANSAAVHLLGFEREAGLIGRKVYELFGDALSFARVWNSTLNEATEVTLTRIGEATQDARPSSFPAFVSKSALPDVIGGEVVVIRDLREVQRRIESETLGRAAYKVAVETSTYALAAASQIESAMTECSDELRLKLERAFANVSRVRDAYSRLAAFHSSSETRVQLSWVDLPAELRALVADLPSQDQKKVELAADPNLPKIVGDYFPLRVVFDTLITPMVRCAPENRSVRVNLNQTKEKITAKITGLLGRDEKAPEQARSASEAHTTAGIAMAYINEVMAKHKAHFNFSDRVDGSREYVLEFPRKV